MTERDLRTEFREFTLLLTLVTEQYGRPISPNVIELYWNALRGYGLPAIRTALNTHVLNPDTGQYMPKIADIVRAIQGGTEDRALRAWAKVDRAVREVGPYASVVFDDPLIHAVIEEMGGWIQFGKKPEKEWPFVAKEFETRYRTLVGRERAVAHPPSLTGLVEADHARHGTMGQTLPPPTIIGDSSRAHEVFRTGRVEDAKGHPLLSMEVWRSRTTKGRSQALPPPSAGTTTPERIADSAPCETDMDLVSRRQCKASEDRKEDV